MKYQPLVQRLFRGSMMAGLALVLLYGVGHAQFFDEKKPIDYEKLFKESLRRNGKFLNLSGKKIGDEGMKHLVGQEWLKKVTKLELRYNKITEQGVRMLAASPSLPNLKTLILRHNFLGDSGAIILAQSKSFPNLVELQLGWNEIRDAGALAFAETKTFPKLQKLDLRGNFLADKTKNELKSSLGNLKSLKLF
ncbi:MAG: hypothetical protein ACE5E9_01460 [Nitrospinaceae bacterium]